MDADPEKARAFNLKNTTYAGFQNYIQKGIDALKR